MVWSCVVRCGDRGRGFEEVYEAAIGPDNAMTSTRQVKSAKQSRVHRAPWALRGFDKEDLQTIRNSSQATFLVTSTHLMPRRRSARSLLKKKKVAAGQRRIRASPPREWQQLKLLDRRAPQCLEIAPSVFLECGQHQPCLEPWTSNKTCRTRAFINMSGRVVFAICTLANRFALVGAEEAKKPTKFLGPTLQETGSGIEF